MEGEGEGCGVECMTYKALLTEHGKFRFHRSVTVIILVSYVSQ